MREPERAALLHSTHYLFFWRVVNGIWLFFISLFSRVFFLGESKKLQESFALARGVYLAAKDGAHRFFLSDGNFVSY